MLTKSQRQAAKARRALLKHRKALEAKRRRWKLERAAKARKANETKFAANGLVKPQKALGAKGFQDLQKQWYAKAAKAGFQDIEWAEDPNSPYLKSPASQARKLVPEKQLYYAMARNYLTHHKFKSRMHKVAWTMHTDGVSYRKILKHLKANFNYNKSIPTIFYFIKQIAAKCKKFNSEHREGLFNQANTDVYASDVLISDFGLTSVGPEGAYDLPIDAGYWESVPRLK